MTRRAVLYAITEEESASLRMQDKETLYDWMLEHIESKYFASDRACSLDKAWDGIHRCLNGGYWCEQVTIPTKVIFSGEFLLDDGRHFISFKNRKDVVQISKYLEFRSLEQAVEQFFFRIDETDYLLPLDENGKQYLLGWISDIPSFYQKAREQGHNVIFTVDF